MDEHWSVALALFAIIGIAVVLAVRSGFTRIADRLADSNSKARQAELEALKERFSSDALIGEASRMADQTMRLADAGALTDRIRYGAAVRHMLLLDAVRTNIHEQIKQVLGRLSAVNNERLSAFKDDSTDREYERLIQFLDQLWDRSRMLDDQARIAEASVRELQVL